VRIGHDVHADDSGFSADVMLGIVAGSTLFWMQ
jgi:hypothetical protein